MTKLRAEWFWTDRWTLSRGFALPMEPRGVYREMLTQSWRRDASLPADEQSIMRLIGATPEEWERSYRLVAPFWRRDGDLIVNDTQLDIFKKAREHYELLSERGRRGGLASGRARARVLDEG